jgi:xylitol oxidase
MSGALTRQAPPAAVSPLYPKLEAFRALAARHDPSGKFRNTYLDRFVFGT